MDFEKNRSQREQEEKLLISAWYNMVSAPAPALECRGHPPGSSNANHTPLSRAWPYSSEQGKSGRLRMLSHSWHSSGWLPTLAVDPWDA